METNLREIGIRIEGVIKKAGISRAKLGEKLGIKEGAVGRQIRGETDPGTVALVKIAEIGNVSLDYLITGEGVGQELPPTDPIEMLIFGNPKTVEKIKDRLRSEVHEELAPYKNELKPDAVRLLDAWEHASTDIKKAALTILEQSAKESREIDGGGSDLAGQQSA
jgi:transcriptional regulator with XRE-family HTH domain